MVAESHYLEVSSTHRRNTHRGSSHRTSFIEYVSEAVYSSRGALVGLGGSSNVPGGVGGTGAGQSTLMEALSTRGQSISSGSVASGGSNLALARDLSVRSETTHSNRVLSNRNQIFRANKSNRTIGKI
jgi:hypothetical protein